MLQLYKTNVIQGRFPNNELDLMPFLSDGSDKEHLLVLTYESSDDLIALQLAKKAIDDNPGHTAKLLMPYVPYSRMDRAMPTHMFTLKYLARLINDLNFTKVVIYDPHSSACQALLDRCVVHYPVQTFLHENPVRSANYENEYKDMLIPPPVRYDLLFYPDAGAVKKYSELLPALPYIYGNKRRNLETGEIISYELVGDYDLTGKRVLIVDDLCEGGRTFVEAAKLLRAAGAAVVELYVTHLMPSARNFYRSKGNGLLDEIHSEDTLNLITYFLINEPKP